MTNKQSGYLWIFSVMVVLVCVTGLLVTGGVDKVVNFLGNAFDAELTFTEHQLDKSLSREQREENINRISENFNGRQ